MQSHLQLTVNFYHPHPPPPSHAKNIFMDMNISLKSFQFFSTCQQIMSFSMLIPNFTLMEMLFSAHNEFDNFKIYFIFDSTSCSLHHLT